MSRSIRVAPENKQRVKVALKRHGFPSQNALAVSLGISRSTTNNFFRGKAIDYSYFVEISERLGLDWEAIAYIEEDPPIELSPPSDTPSEEKPQHKSVGIDWGQVCHAMLEAQNQGRLTTNPLTTGDGVAFELDEIYVPLGLVERKQRRRLGGDVSPEEGSQLYQPETQDEIIQTFGQDEFFEQVLRPGRSKRIAIIGEPGAGKTTLLQKIAAWVLDNTSDVPKFTEALYEWKQERFPTSSIQRKQLNKALGELALQAIASEKTKFRLRHRLLSSVLGKPDEDLFELALQLGWLNQVGVAAEAENRGEKVYAFYHPTFQEYFAAQAISDWHYFLNHIPHNPTQGTYRIFEPSWKEVILLWLGREDVPHEQKEEFIKALIEFEDGCKDLYRYRAYFLAAAGIAEFGDCSWASVIVAQIVKWGFGYFNIEKHKSWTFLKPIEQGARATLPETERSRAILALVQLISSTQDKSTHKQAAEILGKIDPGNQTVFAVLVQLISSTEDESTRWQAAESLGEIDPGNETAIRALVQLISSTEDESTRWQAAESLGKIGTGNETAIATLVQLILSTEDESTRWLAAESLGKIDPGNETAIATLVQLISSTKNESTRWLAAGSLGKIDPGNETAIRALVQLIASVEDNYPRWQAAESLGEIGTGNETAIWALVQLIWSTRNETTCWLAAGSLGKVDPGNPTAIATLVQMIWSTKNESTCWLAAETLGKIDPGNETAIQALVQLMASTNNELIHWRTAETLGKIDPGNPEAIATLVQLIESNQDEFTVRRAADSLGEIGTGNPQAIATLVQLIESTHNESTRRKAAYSLKKILRDEQLAGIVTALKDYLSDESYDQDFKSYSDCYELIWHCAQTMPYPDFYQAWHTQPTSTHPEVLETTTVDSNTFTQSLNLAVLPKSIEAAIANDSALSQTTHLICIDACKFIDRDNPAAKIYAEMLKAGCPKCLDGTPKTMPELQNYWDLLESDKRVVLAFYEGAPLSMKGTQPEVAFSETFLDALSKFDGAIGVITAQSLDNIPLQWISPNEAIAEVVEWIKKITLEA